MEGDIKKAEHRAYARGYQAGRKKAKIERSAEHAQKERQAFLDKAFLSALPVCISGQGWINSKGQKITNLIDRTTLAWNFAQEALKQRRQA